MTLTVVCKLGHANKFDLGPAISSSLKQRILEGHHCQTCGEDALEITVQEVMV